MLLHMLKRLYAITLLLFAFPLCTLAASYYVSTTGSDTTGNGSLNNPWATIGKGCKSMASNDTLIIKSGTYTGVGNMINFLNGNYPPNGSSGQYTVVKAEQNGEVIIDGQNLYIPFDGHNSSYLIVEGIVFKNSSNTCFQMVGNVNNYSTHIKVIKCGFVDPNNFDSLDQSGRAFGIYIRYTNYSLIEDCYNWGNGMYRFLVLDSNYIILRRCVCRMDRTHAEQYSLAGAFRFYAANNSIMQNCIAIDADQPEYMLADGTNKAEPKMIWFGSNTSTSLPCSNNIAVGCIVLNCTANCFAGFNGTAAADLTVKNNRLANCVFWKVSNGFINRSENAPQNRAFFDHCVFGNIANSGLASAITGDSAGIMISSNSVCYNIAGAALQYTSSDYNVFYNNTSNYSAGSSPGTHDFSAQNSNVINPLYSITNTAGGLKYLPRIESPSNLSSKASDASAIGASILKKIGVTGTIYGEPGYNDITAESLWPFPNEEIIRSHMRTYSYTDGVHAPINGERGFCAPGQTLTKYIWEYLGSPLPSGMYVLNAPSNLTATAISANSIRLGWSDNSFIESGFRIQRKAGVDRAYIQIASLGPDTTSYLDSTLSTSTTYYYRLLTWNSELTTAFTNEASAQTLSILSPTLLTATSLSPTSVKLTWTDTSNNELGFRIQRKSGTDGNYLTIADVSPNVTAYIDNNLTSSTVYYYRVFAYNVDGNSGFSSEAPIATSSLLGGISLGQGEMKIIGSQERKGAINPDLGDTATIYFKGTTTGRYDCKIFAMSGQLIWQDKKENVQEGSFVWVPHDIASGGYVVTIHGPNFSAKKKLVIIR